MAELAAEAIDAITGHVLQEAFKALVYVVQQNLEHTELVRKTLERLETLKDLFDRIPSQKVLGDTAARSVKKKLDDGKKLIEDCHKHKRRFKNGYGILKKMEYNDELRTLNESIDFLFKVVPMYQQNNLAETIGSLRDNNLIEEVKGMRCELTKPPSFTIGLDKPLKKLKELILEPGKSMLLVTAPAGCGKTTLAQLLYDEKEVKERFKDNIFLVEMSTKYDLQCILDDLYAQRGYDYKLPTKINNENITLTSLRDFLGKDGRPLLLVLDGVWRDEGYDKVLKVFDEMQLSNDVKILVTSRFHFKNLGSSYHLKWLVDADARELFHYSASLEDESSEESGDQAVVTRTRVVRSQWIKTHLGPLYCFKWLEDADAEQLFHHSASLGGENCPILKSCPREVTQVLKNCKGLPLAIAKVGEILRNEKLPDAWKKVLLNNSILEYATEVHEVLESSLKAFENANHNNNKALKNCFLDLASFPEDRLISAAALIDIWSLSETYDNYTNAQVDLMCINNLHTLKDRSLANIVHPSDNTNGYYGEYFVTQYVLLRELAIQQSEQPIGKESKDIPLDQRERIIVDICGGNSSKWKKQRTISQPMKARLLAISTDRELTEFSTEWQLPDLEVLVLNLQTDKYELLREFMEQVDKLKVLIVTHYGPSSSPAELSNFHLLSLLSNLKRVRLERISIPCIVNNPLQLKNAEKISFFMCDIVQAFSNSSFNFSEAFPKLEELSIDYCIVMEKVPANLCDHKELQRLSITNCLELKGLPEEIGNLKNLEELRLLGCTRLSNLPQTVGKLTRLMLLDVSGCTSVEIPSGIRDIFKSNSEKSFIE